MRAVLALVVLAACPAPKQVERGPAGAATSPALTTGKMEGFRELYVDPDDFIASLKPAAAEEPEPEPEPTPEPPVDDMELGAIFHATLAEGCPDFEAIDAAATAFDKVEVMSKAEAYGNLIVKLKKSDLPALQALEVGAKPLSECTEMMLLPARLAPRWPVPKAPEPEDIDPDAEPDLLAEPKTGDLPVENIASARAEVEINGVMVGQIGPYTTAVVHGVPFGTYDVRFTVPNGYTRPTKAAATREPLSTKEPLAY